MQTPDGERYPIGPPDRTPEPGSRPGHLHALRTLPEQFGAALAGLTAEQLDTTYREGGWTLRQLAHHLADSHMNAWVRLKLALTENWPTIKPYDEALWAESPEYRGPIEPPLALLGSLHARMVALLESLTPGQWQLGYVHPESGRATVEQMVALYSWHGRHHTAHVTRLRERMGW